MCNIAIVQKTVHMSEIYSTAVACQSTESYVVSTQKNRLNEPVLLGTKTHVKTDGKENIYQFTTRNYVYLTCVPYNRSVRHLKAR